MYLISSIFECPKGVTNGFIEQAFPGVPTMAQWVKNLAQEFRGCSH